MCKWGTDKEVRLCKPQPISGRWIVGVDSCIADLVQALNNAGIATTNCCCGHGKVNGSILLDDGRELIIKCPVGRKEAEMPEFNLGDVVTIAINGTKGKIIGTWYSLYGQPQYLIRYCNQTGSVIDAWLTVDCLIAA